jgi:hypothetical protein
VTAVFKKTRGEGKGDCCLQGKLNENERVTAASRKTTGEGKGDSCLRGKLEEKKG